MTYISKKTGLCHFPFFNFRGSDTICPKIHSMCQIRSFITSFKSPVLAAPQARLASRLCPFAFLPQACLVWQNGQRRE